jgi:hypothetical protein
MNACGNGYYLNTETTECKRCSANCATCLDEEQCDTCAGGFDKLLFKVDDLTY